MILRKFGSSDHVIICCVVTLASVCVHVSGDKEGRISLKEYKSSLLNKPKLYSFQDAQEGIEPQIEGCETGKKILRFGEYRQVGCGRFECQNSNGIPKLIYKSCALPSNDSEDGCTILPPKSQEFPKCCEREVICQRIEVIEVPFVYSLSNVSEIQKGPNTHHKPNEKSDSLELVSGDLDGGSRSNGARTGSFTGKSSGDRERREVGTLMLPKTETQIQGARGCVDGNQTLKIGEHRPLEGCGQKICQLMKDNLLALVFLSCNQSIVPPENCVPAPGLHLKPFPECCAVEYLCTEVHEEVFPVVYTAANISELESNDPENYVEPDRFLSVSDPQGTAGNASKTIVNPKIMESSISSESNVNSRSRRATFSTIQSSEDPGTEMEGCPIGNKTLRIGDTIPIEGCAQLKCVVGENFLALVIHSCGPSETDIIPYEDCRRVNTDEKYPECCNVKFVCVKTILVPTHSAKANTSHLLSSEFSNVIESDSPALPVDYATTKQRTTPLLERQSPGKVSEEIRQKRETRQEAVPIAKTGVDGCQIGNNKTLMVGENIKLKGCGRLVCILNKTHYHMMAEICDHSRMDIEEGCQIQASSENYPNCCKVEIVCTKSVEHSVPILFTAANISKLEKDNEVNSNQEIFITEDLSFDPSLEIRNKRDTPLLKSATPKYVNETCNFGNQTLKIGDRIPGRECAQVECVSRPEGPTLIVVRCDDSGMDLQDGCEIQSPTNPNYPYCCEVEIVCKQVAEYHVPVLFTADNISKLENDNKVDPNYEVFITDDFNHDLTSKTRNKREASSTETKTSKPEKETCKYGNETLKINEHIPGKGCSQLECSSGPSGLEIIIRSCNRSTVNVAENCKILPPSSLEFPQCCGVVFSCTRVVTTVTAEINEEYVFPELANNDIELANAKSVSLNPGKEGKLLEDRTKSNEPGVKRQKRETTSEQIISDGCDAYDRTLKAGNHFSTKGCAQTKCVLGPNGPYFETLRCDPPKNQSNEDCYFLPPASSEFPKCCARIFVCKTVLNQLLPVNKISNITEEQDKNTHLNLSNEYTTTSQSSGILKDLKGRTHSLVRQKREASSVGVQNRKKGLEECQLDGNRALAKDEALPLKGCGQVKCTSEKGSLVLIAVSCNQTTNDIPEGCSVVNKPKQPYPECCKVELVCTKVVTKVIPVSVNASDINDFKRNEETKLDIKIKNITDITDSGVTMSNLHSRTVEETTKTKPTLRGNVKFSAPSVNRVNMFDYKEFIERSRRYTKNKNDSSASKPTFVLPVRRRTNRRRDNELEYPKDDQLALEVKNSEVITISPTKTDEREDSVKRRKKSPNKITKTERPKTRRRLSALLSAKNLRRSYTESTKEKNVTKLNDPIEYPANKTESKENEETLSAKPSLSRQRLRNRYKKRNNSEAARLAQRRRLYANRRNRLKPTIKPIDKESRKEVTSDTESNKEKKKPQVNINEEESKNSTNAEKLMKRRTRPKLIRKNFSPKNRRNGRRRTKNEETDTVKKDNKESKKLPVKAKNTDAEASSKTKKEGKQESESKKLSARTRITRKRNKNEERKEKAKPKKRVQRRRKRPLIKNVTTSESKESEATEPSSAKTAKQKPTFTLKTLDIKKIEPKTETERGRNVFDLSKVNPEEVKKVPNKKRAPSQSKVLRQRLKIKAKEDVKQENDKHKTSTPPKPKPIKILQPPTPHSRDGSLANTVSPFYTHSYYTEPPFLSKFENTLDDFEKLYEFPIDDLELSSSDKDSAKSPDTEENEIPEVPDVPIKVTTLTFSTSRRSFKSSKTRNTSKKFHETPSVYGSEETYKAVTYR